VVYAHQVLKDFLEKHSSEVVNMLITEWNWDCFIEVREREAREVGRLEGQLEGEKKGQEKAFQNMCEIARKMKGRGLSPAEIAELTGVSQELIETF
jgi:predicted transposase YdaD